MQTCLIEPGDPRWAEVLRLGSHEFYHLPGYTRIEADRMQGTPLALYAEDGERRLLLPLVIRPVPHRAEAAGSGDSCLDASSPWGYPGPLTVGTKDASDPFLQEALTAGKETLKAHGVIALFVRLSPLLQVPSALSNVGTLTAHGPCFWLDLQESAEELHQQMRSRYRSYLNALRRDGVHARFVPFADRMDEFIALNHHTMDRVGAADWYYFDRTFYEALNRLLGDSLKLCVVELGTTTLAAGLFIASGGIVQYYLSGADKGLGQPHATKLMMVLVRDWAKASGQRYFNLGGGLGATEDPLSQFKRGFTKHSSTFHTWRLITDEEKYRSQVSEWETQSGLTADTVEGFFPAYRKAISIGTPALRLSEDCEGSCDE